MITQPFMRSSYRTEDVILLLKDITGLVEPLPAAEREKKIQGGAHYCEMLPREYRPSLQYKAAYHAALSAYAAGTAAAVCRAAENIRAVKGNGLVLVSLARAGIPAGILIKRYLQKKYRIDPPHYALSIIRGMGIDKNALDYILARHTPGSLQFVDGWTGKGAISATLEEALSAYSGVSDTLCVLSDPANLTELQGTHEDILIPSSCLNSTVSGLISRTFFRSDIIQSKDFHGAAFYEELADEDLSYSFIEAVEACFDLNASALFSAMGRAGLSEVQEIARHYSVSDLNLIKPGIGETTRVLLRRVPWKILIAPENRRDPRLAHLYQLAEEKGVPIENYPLSNYTACGIIRSLGDL